MLDSAADHRELGRSNCDVVVGSAPEESGDVLGPGLTGITRAPQAKATAPRSVVASQDPRKGCGSAHAEGDLSQACLAEEATSVSIRNQGGLGVGSGSTRSYPCGVGLHLTTATRRPSPHAGHSWGSRPKIRTDAAARDSSAAVTGACAPRRLRQRVR